MRRRLFLWGGVLASMIAATLSFSAFVAVESGSDARIIFLFGLATSLTCFLLAYLIAFSRHAARVERTVASMTKDLVTAIRRQEEANRIKDQFLAHVSHELRTPLAIVREGVAQASEEILPADPRARQEALEIALRNLDRLGRLIEDLLDVSKIESGRMPMDRRIFDVCAAAREVTSGFETVARRKGLKLRLELPEDPVLVYADRDRVTQVFTNLLGNALKFTESGSVTVSVREEGDAVHATVTDTGPGIAEPDPAKVFEKFQTSGWRAGSGRVGAGLGLAISKGIVELHGGKIWAERQTGGGTEFHFVLPKTERELQHAA